MSEASTTLGARLPASGTPRERILEAAYELFSRHGLQAVGVNSVVERSRVAKRTLYRTFGSKDELMALEIGRLLLEHERAGLLE